VGEFKISNNMDNQEKTSGQSLETKKHLKVLSGKLSTFLSADKPSDVLIIKAHLICEYYLNQILILKEICSDKDIDELSFYDKSNKAFASGDAEQKILLKSLRILNKLRNRVGHELEYKFLESDVDKLGFVSGKEYVLKKYEFDDPLALLRSTLVSIVVDVAIELFALVSVEKERQQKEEALSENK
jgi:hypothetical protein